MFWSSANNTNHLYTSDP